MTNISGKEITTPKGTHNASSLKTLQSITESSIKSYAQGELLPYSKGLRSTFLGEIADKVGNALRGIVEGVADIPGFLKISQATGQIRDGQLALVNRTDLLSPLLDYGSCHMPLRKGASALGVAPMVVQIGPMRGCELYRDGILLKDKGLWDLRAQITADNYFTPFPLPVEWRIIVKRPDGSIFSEQRNRMTESGVTTSTLVSSVVVPTAGYYAQVEVTNISLGRGLLGGPAYSRFTVQHMSRETNVGSTGAGISDTATTQE